MNYTKAMIFIVGLSAMVVWSCAEHSDNAQDTKVPDRSGLLVLEYEIFDDQGQKLTTGELLLPRDYENMNEFEGYWTVIQVTPAFTPDVHGPLDQIASFDPPYGTFYARIARDQMYINLHPGVIDHNIIMLPDTHTLSRGRWKWESDAGITARGTFVANPKHEKKE